MALDTYIDVIRKIEIPDKEKSEVGWLASMEE
jgi:hypothetical protein